ncbi:serine/threonine-protein kinase WNK4-like isoform X2 [Amphibalanus amphitrite]|uniref:serine/threonine-protein kinase WNK4-like isoform X2 n=1 Tax=Amphibalanus amphitrite TaxID=1232801 RepID=UPI001C91293D|nr:serine/threonine-protein kinase WNK4-like isoform X2 [Amphibalanus amphitrite]
MYTDKAARSNVGGGWHEGHKPAPPRPANSTVAGGSRIIIQSRLDHISINHHQAGHAAGHHVLGMAQPARSVMPNMLKKESGSGVQRPTTANGGTMSKIRQSGAKFLHKTAQRLSLREEPPEVPDSASGAGPSESTSSGSVSQHAGPSSRQDRTSQSSGGVHSKPNQSTASAATSAISKPERASGAGSAATRPDRPPSAGSTSKAPFGKKAATPQPEPRPAPTPLKRRSASTDAACGTGSGAGRPRPSAVRHRDRPRDGGKVCFAPRVQMLGPSDSEERQERDDSPLAEEQEQERQAESMRRLERENESLRHAIENYRDLERRRAAGGSGGPGGAGQDAKGQEETAEDGEEDEVEKAVEVSPSGVFLKFSEEIGRGSFKAVYKGLDTTTGVFVAWCELQLSGNRLSKKERDRFREEAGLMKGLTHPNIVRFYDFWEVDKPKRSCIVLVTELMTSGTLRTYLKNFGQKRVSLKIIKQWCRQILRGLQFLHSRNPPIIHRDLKCDNIFISGTTGQVKVGDLGLATLKNRSFAKSVIGTPEFMAPEVYEEHYDEAVDVYAFGMCMLEMVTSEYPYSECTGPAQIYKKVITGIKPSSFDKIDDPQTRDLIEWCTRLNSKERPTVKQLLNHEFFAEDCGMRLEVANREEAMNSGSSVIHLQLRVLDAKKRKDTHKENEAIQFNYVLNKDNPEETAKQMLMSGLLAEENCRPLAKMITNVIQSLVRAREERRRDQVPQTQSAPAAGPPGAAPGPGASLVPTAAAPAPVPLHLSASLPVISSSQSAQPAAAQVHTATAVLSAAPGAPLASVAAAAPVTVTVAATQTQPSHQPGGTETAPAETRQAEPPPPAAPTEAAGAQPQHGQTEAHSDSATGAESDSALGERKEKKNRARRRKTCERLPRLTVLEVKNSDNGPVVSCLLETNQSQAITFKFDLHEADVTAISHKMTEAQLLPKDDAQYFEEQLRAVVRRQRELRSTGANQPPPPPHADEDTHPAQATGRRSRFIVSSVVESKASPMPSPCLLSPASEQPLNILTSAGSATTSVSPSPQVALISPEPLSPPPVSSALHSPQDPAPTALSPSATPALSTSPVPGAGVGETAGLTSAAGLPAGQGSTSVPVGSSVVPEPAGSGGTPTAPIAVPSGSSQKSDGQARPPSLSISPGSRASQAKSGATVTTPTAQRHVRFAVTPTILNPICPSSSDSSLASVTAVTSASDSQSSAASGSGVQTSLAGPSSHASTSTSSTPPLISSTAAVGLASGPAPAPSATTPVSASLTAPSGLTPSLVTGGTSPGTLSLSVPSPGTLSPTGILDSSHPTPNLSPGEVPSHPAGATISEAHRANAVAQEGRPPVPARPVTGGQSLSATEEPEERRTAAGPQEQPTTPIDASMGNLAQLAKQLNRLTSQPGEAAGSGTQTPSDGAPTARRLTATGAGPTPTQRSGADGGGGTPSPSQQTVPLQPAGTGVSATGSPADLSRSASGTDAASATGSEARRKQVPLHLTDLAKKLDKLRVKPPGGAAVASAAAGTASTAVQTTTPLDDASKPLAVGGAQPVATPSGPPPETARVQPNVNQMDVQAATPAVNGTASDVSPEGGSRPVRRGRFAISKATTAAQPPAPAPAPAAAPAPSAAQTPSPVNSVEEMAMYRELIARQQAAMIELLRQQEVERENLRQRLRQQHQQQHEQQLQQQQQQQQQRHPPCTENGPV